MTKSKPQRKCIGCNEMKDKKDLIRIVKDEKDVFIDPTGKANGRGAYICQSSECFRKAIKQRKLDHALKCSVNRELIEKLETLMNKTEGAENKQ